MGFFGKSFDLIRKYKACPAKREARSGVLVPFPGHGIMPLAWWLTRRPKKRLIFDAFISLHDTEVSDRRRFSALNPYAWVLWMMDWLSMHLADDVLIDTEAHRQFLIKKFGLSSSRVRVIYLEARPDLFKPATDNQQRATRNSFEVFFYGTLIPLQGVDVILEAARLLKDSSAHFTLLGPQKLSAFLYKHPLPNVTYHSFVPLEQIPDFIRNADLCLGIFGTSEKARRVIPHKVIDSVACGVPVITADTPAIRERFADHPLVTLIPAGNAQALADAIKEQMGARSFRYD